MWSEKDLDKLRVGVVPWMLMASSQKEAFTSPVYSLARIRFDDLRAQSILN